MKTRRRTKWHDRKVGMPEVFLGTFMWGSLLIILLAAVSLPELGGWPGWLWTTGR